MVRGVAILLAMGWHINHIGTGNRYLDILLYPGSQFGWVGVDLFFVLSGFLIGGMILREVGKTGSFDYGAFLIRRIFRLWPTLYFFLFSMLLLGGFSWRDWFWQIALHLQNYVHTKSATHLWSLAVEEHFYIVLGMIFPICLKYSKVEKWLPHLLILILLICPLLRFIAFKSGVSSINIQTETHFRLDALASAVLIAFIAWKSPCLFKRFLNKRLIWAAVTLLSVCFFIFVQKGTPIGQTLGFTISWFGGVSFLLLIYRSGIERVSKKFCYALALLGQISYPLYLWHVPVTKITESAALKLTISDYPYIAIFIAYAGSIIVALMCSKFIEYPFMRFRDILIPPRVTAVEVIKSETIPSI